ncbi:ATP-binding protein [Mucilaginibacter gossypii]|uniref:Signal transduction histidine kinase n=1 Tax=Mucilaginibacter gossypii TaxID=551996 RepID=A0A1G8CZD4_9SPHI|nr:ATP-binding protein [Mucilaginibacter gossypii]SDH50290.1 Signal transduction histidine kinase [Mucilaginibacter gossypii]
MGSKPRKVHFKTNVLLKSIIGKDLINDDNIAILELVKNSYDAGSPYVSVEFKNIKANDDKQIEEGYTTVSSKIIIQDYGKGMTQEDIENKWINIAYSEKKSAKESNNRLLAGNKGVGRFSCDRLGEYLDLYSKSPLSNSYVHLQISWGDFETENRDDLTEEQKKDLEIQQITFDLYDIDKGDFQDVTGHKPFDQGTILEISRLRSNWTTFEKNNKSEWWTTDKLIKLRKYLEKLINPNQAFQENPFTIEVIADEFTLEDSSADENAQVGGVIKNKIFDKLDFTATNIESSINKTGSEITTSLQDKGRLIFKLVEKNTQFDLLRDVHVILYFLNTYSKIYFTKQTGIRSVDFGSVFLFINGFMIPPYGEEGNDWLGLEIRKGQGQRRFLSTRDLIGRIEVRDTNSEFKIISSREGVVNDENFQQLTESFDAKKNKKDGYFYYTFKRLEKYVVDGLKWDRVTGEEDLGEDESLSKKRAKIIKDFENKTLTLTPSEAQKEELYYESETSKNKRIISIIQNIIDVKKENIIELYINDELISDLIKEEEEETRKSIEKLLNEIDSLPSTEVESALSRIEKSRESLESMFSKISLMGRNATDDETKSALDETKSFYQEFSNSYTVFKNAIVKLTAEKKIAENKAEEDEKERDRLESELASEKQKNTYLLATRRTLSDDADGLIHTLKINSINIRDAIDNLLLGISSSSYSQTDIINKLGNIKINAERSLQLAEIATRSNFTEDIESRTVDIVGYFDQYLSIYDETYSIGEDEKIEFLIQENGAHLIKSLSVLNLSIIIDNLISNSKKWDAKKMEFAFSNPNQNTLSLKVSDDGKGLVEKFLDDPERIFELGISATPPSTMGGSGIGLYFTRKLLADMDAQIHFVGNAKVFEGATFEIVFKNTIYDN